MASGFLGAMGGCAMIGQSMININSGARHRLSGVAAALFLLGFGLFGSAVIERIPLAALAGVMLMVVIETFEWASFKMMRRVPRADVFVIVFVTVVTLATDLAVVVLSGVVVSALVFAWESAKKIQVKVMDLPNPTGRVAGVRPARGTVLRQHEPVPPALHPGDRPAGGHHRLCRQPGVRPLRD